MKKYKDLKQNNNTNYQQQALDMLLQVAIANGSNKECLTDEHGLKIISPKSIGLGDGRYSNDRYTKGMYICTYLVDCMESAYTVMGKNGSALQIELWCNKTWKDFCEEFAIL